MCGPSCRIGDFKTSLAFLLTSHFEWESIRSVRSIFKDWWNLSTNTCEMKYVLQPSSSIYSLGGLSIFPSIIFRRDRNFFSMRTTLTISCLVRRFTFQALDFFLFKGWLAFFKDCSVFWASLWIITLFSKFHVVAFYSSDIPETKTSTMKSETWITLNFFLFFSIIYFFGLLHYAFLYPSHLSGRLKKNWKILYLWRTLFLLLVVCSLALSPILWFCQFFVSVLFRGSIFTSFFSSLVNLSTFLSFVLSETCRIIFWNTKT